MAVKKSRKFSPLMSRNACNGENGENDKRPRPLETGNFGENGDCSEIGNFGKNRQKCMQWQKWQKIASHWRFQLDAKSGPLEAGDFGDIQNVAKYLNWMPKVAASK